MASRCAQARPDESSLEVSFAGLSFRKPEGLRFRYRLLGLDDAPVETALREVRYARLPPGSYTFEVACRHVAMLHEIAGALDARTADADQRGATS